jgi:hypothetical protein
VVFASGYHAGFLTSKRRRTPLKSRGFEAFTAIFYPLGWEKSQNYSECEGMLAALTEAGVVQPTGQTVRSGFVDVPVCELQGPFREPTLAEGVEGTRGRSRVR